jgi:hypothetical protein
LPSTPGGAMVNQTANAISAAIGTNQRDKLVIRDGVVVCSIALIIWAYTMICKKGSILEYH